MATAPNSSEIKEFIESIKKATKVAEQWLPDIKNKNEEISQQIKKLEIDLTKQSKDLEKTNENVKSILSSVHTEVDRMDTFNTNLHSLFTERIDGIKKDVNGLIDRDIPALAKISDIHSIKDRLIKLENNIDNLPGLKEITENLTHDNSPLCTKEDLAKLTVQVAEIKGKSSINFWATIATMISVLSGILLIYSRFPSPQSVHVSPVPKTQQP